MRDLCFFIWRQKNAKYCLLIMMNTDLDVKNQYLSDAFGRSVSANRSSTQISEKGIVLNCIEYKQTCQFTADRMNNVFFFAQQKKICFEQPHLLDAEQFLVFCSLPFDVSNKYVLIGNVDIVP